MNAPVDRHWPPKFLERKDLSGMITNINHPDTPVLVGFRLPAWIKFRPMERVVLLALAKAGERGMSMAEFFMTYRISSGSLTRRITEITRNGYDVIALRREDQDGTKYTRYVLTSQVEALADLEEDVKSIRIKKMRLQANRKARNLTAA